MSWMHGMERTSLFFEAPAYLCSCTADLVSLTTVSLGVPEGRRRQSQLLIVE